MREFLNFEMQAGPNRKVPCINIEKCYLDYDEVIFRLPLPGCSRIDINIDMDQLIVCFICQYMGYKKTLNRIYPVPFLRHLNLNISPNYLKLLAIFESILRFLP